VIVLLFASSRIPAALRGLGAGLHEFRKGVRRAPGGDGMPAPPRS
jgi:Sec-independent protein translocase protein TatA